MSLAEMFEKHREAFFYIKNPDAKKKIISKAKKGFYVKSTTKTSSGQWVGADTVVNVLLDSDTQTTVAANFLYGFLFTPWKTSTHMDNGDVVVRDATNRIIANFSCDAGSHPNRLRQQDIDQYAILFSVAPQLLAALEGLVEKMEEDQTTGVDEGIYENEPREDIAALRELIEKAKGA